MERLNGMKTLMRVAAVVAMVVAGMPVVLPAGPASAAPSEPDVVTVSRSITATTVPGIATGTELCPDGYRLVGSGGGNGQILAEYPTASFNGATLVAVMSQATQPIFITITCAPAGEFGDVTTSTTSYVSSPGTMVRGVTRCPGNYWAFGGGGYFLEPGGGRLGAASSNSSNAPSADGNAWTFSGVVPSGATSMVMVTQCAPRTGHDFVNQLGPISTNANTPISTYVYCPAGWTAVAGGFYVSNPDGTEGLPGTVIWSVPASTETSSSWFAAGYAPVGDRVVALVQCLI